MISRMSTYDQIVSCEIVIYVVFINFNILRVESEIKPYDDFSIDFFLHKRSGTDHYIIIRLI